VAGCNAAGEHNGNAEQTLYQRLGGYDIIAAIMSDYVNRMRADSRFARFAGGRSTDKKMRDLQLNIDYMCKLTGGPLYYLGRDLKTSHAGLNITESEWDANMQHMAEALGAQKIPEKERDEFLTFWDGMKRDIVEAR
jgi:hemoglobin